MADRPRAALIDLPDIGDAGRGYLTVAEAGTHVPFDPRRLFVLHSLPAGAERGFHAHRAQHQLLMLLAGACTVIVDDGAARTPIRLQRPAQGLHVPPLLWLELVEFTPDAVCAVLASDGYDEADYIRDRAEFERLTA